MGHFKTTKMLKYNRIIISNLFKNDILSLYITLLQNTNEDQKWSLFDVYIKSSF